MPGNGKEILYIPWCLVYKNIYQATESHSLRLTKFNIVAYHLNTWKYMYVHHVLSKKRDNLCVDCANNQIT